MQRLFRDQQCQSLLYLDEMNMFSSSDSQYLQWLEVVLVQIQKEDLKAKLEKCAFFQWEVSYLGHVMSSMGVYTNPKRLRQ